VLEFFGAALRHLVVSPGDEEGELVAGVFMRAANSRNASNRLTASRRFAVATHPRWEEARTHEARIRPPRAPAEICSMDIPSLIILAVVVVAAVVVSTLDDPIGEELDRIRSRNQLQALQTPLFLRAD
jgi:hypothetical protein